MGISKAHDATELPAAMNEAARFDRKIVIEQGVGGKRNKAREIECAVLGNDEPIASICGEIIPAKEFYDYNAKYIDAAREPIFPPVSTTPRSARYRRWPSRLSRASSAPAWPASIS